jgi:hypothetical protein
MAAAEAQALKQTWEHGLLPCPFVKYMLFLAVAAVWLTC